MTDETPQLATKLKFWYQHFKKGQNFQESLVPVCVVSSFGQFWKYYQHFKRPSKMVEGSYIYLFKQQIKPVWEDQHNVNGGAFVLRFQKEKCDRIWEDVLLSFVKAKAEEIDGINGIRVKIRKDDLAQIDLWVGNTTDEEKLEKQRLWLAEAVSLDKGTPIDLTHFYV